MSNININDENFSDLLEQSFIKGDSLSAGDVVKGTVILVTDEIIFVDIQAKSEAVLDAKEFINDNGTKNIKAGDSIIAYVASIKHGEIILTSAIGKGHISQDLLYTAYKNQLPVYGVVKQSINGGFIVSVGSIQAFCPLSQIDSRVGSNETYLNKSFNFSIIRYEQQGKNIILSRRRLLEKIKEETVAELKQQLKIGDIVTATINQVIDAGLLVHLDLLDAFIPRSECSYSRVFHHDNFKQGENITAKIIDLDWDKVKITLSIKEILPEPWSFINQFQIGNTYTGTVNKIIKNGAFVELKEGLEGFIPLSRMSYSKKINDPHSVCNEGDTVQVTIIDIDESNKKITLELVTGEENPWLTINDTMTQSIYTASIEEITSRGLVVNLPNQIRAFLPREHCAIDKNADITKLYQNGNAIKVALLQVDADDRRCLVSEKKAIEIEERSAYQQFAASNDSKGSTSFGQLFKKKYDELLDKGNKP